MSAAASLRTTAVVGLGVSGMSCLRHLSVTDALVVIDDRSKPANLERAKDAFPQAKFFIGANAVSPDRWQGVERIVLSPGVAANDPVLTGSEGLPRMSDIDLFMQSAQAPVVGITGTNGKSTVTALLGHVLNELGVAVRIGGNLGEPALNLLSLDTEVYVLELSSFQIEHSQALPLAAAAVLNVSPDHLDRHGDLESYAAIKRRVYNGASCVVSNADDCRTKPPTGVSASALASFGLDESADWQLSVQDGKSILQHDGVEFARDSSFQLVGQHNLLNLLAVFALASQLKLPGLPPFADAADRYVAAAASFTGLSHRAEFVRELHGVRYVNDSKATNVGACVAALAGFKVAGENASRRVVLLAGGQGKDADFSPLGAAAGACVKQAVLYGEDADLIEAALAGHTETKRCGSFEDAVSAASDCAAAGDTVLLAPACASFDMFASFTARGERFCELVEKLA